MKIRTSNHKLMIEIGRNNQTSSNDRFCPICNSGITEDEFHFIFHYPKYSIPREKFYNQIKQNFVYFNQLFVSLCNDLRNNLLSNHVDDTWLTVVIIALHYRYDFFYIKACVLNKAQLCASSACISGHVLSDKEQN